MSAPDLHPEELLDKAAAETLSDAERAWLDTHLAQCSVCRFELQARKDFQTFESPGLNVDNLVAQALSGIPARPAALAPRRALGLARFAIAAVVLLTTMVSFAAVTGVLPKIIEAFTSPPPPPVPAPVPERLPPPRAAPVETVAPPPQPEAVVEEAPAPAPVRAARPASMERVAIAPPPPVDLPDAGSLFSRANQARIAGDRPQAVKLYGELLQQFPAADEAKLVQATLGRLLLDSGDPQGALTQLDAYLQSGDATLREEVLAARATALSRLNRPRDEAAAWNALLDSYPDSVHASRARARLADLEPR